MKIMIQFRGGDEVASPYRTLSRRCHLKVGPVPSFPIFIIWSCHHHSPDLMKDLF